MDGEEESVPSLCSEDKIREGLAINGLRSLGVERVFMINMLIIGVS